MAKFDFLGLIAKFFDFLFGRTGSDKEKHALRVVSKQLSKSGYKYYSFARDEIKPGFASVLFSIYKIVAPLRVFFMDNNNMEQYKNLVVVYMMSDKQKKMYSDILPETIRAMQAEKNFEVMVQECKSNISTLKDSYSSEQYQEVNSLFTSLSRLCSFCLFDYYMLLKKFDTNLCENRFDLEPKFIASPKTFCAEQIDQFLQDYFSLIDCHNWPQVFDMLSVIQGFSFAGVEEFEKVITTLQLLERKRVLARMAKIVRNDSHFEFNRDSELIDVVTPFLQSAEMDMENILGEMHRELRMEKINSFTEKLFAGMEMVSLSNYTEERAQIYVNKGLPGFIYAEHSFYIYSFSELFIKKELANFAEIFSMKAKSILPNYVEYFAQVYKELLNQCASLVQIDKLLDEKFSSGYRLKVLWDKQKTDSSAYTELEEELNKLNEKVMLIISSVQENINTLYMKLCELLRDRNSPLGRYEFVSNWDELDGLLKVKSFAALTSICEHMKDFVGLIEVLVD